MTNIIHILWTGGWDSTFRVLEAVIIENKVIQPHYIIDPARHSFYNEIIAMNVIRKRFTKKYPDKASQFLSLNLVHIDTIPLDREITNWYLRLESKTVMGTQYEWLARYAKYHPLEMELCMEYVPPPSGEQLFLVFVQPSLKHLGEGHSCRVDGPYIDPGVEMFSFFRFPVRHLKKDDMRRIAEKNGFIDLMKLAWFCENPIKGIPCGICSSCITARDSGMKYEFYSPITWYLFKQQILKMFQRN